MKSFAYVCCIAAAASAVRIGQDYQHPWAGEGGDNLIYRDDYQSDLSNALSGHKANVHSVVRNVLDDKEDKPEELSVKVVKALKQDFGLTNVVEDREEENAIEEVQEIRADAIEEIIGEAVEETKAILASEPNPRVRSVIKHVAEAFMDKVEIIEEVAEAVDEEVIDYSKDKTAEKISRTDDQAEILGEVVAAKDDKEVVKIIEASNLERVLYNRSVPQYQAGPSYAQGPGRY